jgi:hypothetical protein
VTRIAIENAAIDKIIKLEPALNRTSNGNPGFDLYGVDADGKEARWIEVKSMTGSLQDRPVGLSRAQFDFALSRRSDFWLYIVEYATDAERTRILRIQDPIANARTFTFDHGWEAIAEELPKTKLDHQ